MKYLHRQVLQFQMAADVCSVITAVFRSHASYFLLSAFVEKYWFQDFKEEMSEALTIQKAWFHPGTVRRGSWNIIYFMLWQELRCQATQILQHNSWYIQSMCLHDLQSIAAPCPGSRAGPALRQQYYSARTITLHLQYCSTAPVLQARHWRGPGCSWCGLQWPAAGQAQHLNPHLQHSTGWRGGDVFKYI